MNGRLNKLIKEYTADILSHSADNAVYAEKSLLFEAAKLIRKYRPQLSQYFCSYLLDLEARSDSMAAQLGKLDDPLSLLERISLREKEASDWTETWTPEIEDSEEVDLDEELLESSTVVDLLTSGPSFWNFTAAIRRAMYCDDKAKMIGISRTVVQGISWIQLGYCTHCKELETDSIESFPFGRTVPVLPHSYYCIKFELDWRPLEFVTSQYGNHVPELAHLVTLNGSAFYACATTCSEYLSQNWPGIGSFFLSSFQDALALTIRRNAEKTWFVYGKHSIAHFRFINGSKPHNL
jgi:hypothetical protein